MAVLEQLKKNYNEQGYFLIKDFFSTTEVSALREVILKFHESWKYDHAEFYRDVAFNSSLITGSEYLSEIDRIALFNFIGSTKMIDLMEAVVEPAPAFMNTQLFFNPINPELKDFWHRDCQYDYDLDGQKKVMAETQVMHLRVPLFDELGMELIPGTHKRWDTPIELAVREEVKGHTSSDDLPNSVKIPLSAGDLLVFSADMIHRGLYGMDRLALDILVFDCSANYIDYIDPDCLPDTEMLQKLDNPSVYQRTLSLISGN